MYEYIFNPLFAIFILTVIAAFFVWINSVKDSKIRDQINSGVDTLKIQSDETIRRLKDANRDISVSLEKTKKANEQLAENNQKISENYRKTIEAKEAIIDAQKDIIGQITGGDSYPSIVMTRNQFFLLVNGTYGIPNLNIQIYYLKDYTKIPSKIVSDYLLNKTQTEYIYEIYNSKCRNLGVGIVHPISYDSLKSEFNNKISHGIDIVFQGDFKSWIQRIRLIPINDKYEVFEELEEIISYNKTRNLGNTRKQLFIKVSDNFPYINKDGENRYCPSNCLYIFDHKVHPIPIPNILHKILKKNIIPPYEIDFFS